MGTQILIALAVKAVQLALCQFFKVCENHEDCPDGVCVAAQKAIDEVGEKVAEPVAQPTTQSFGFNPDWTKLQPLVEATVAFLGALRAFLGVK